MRETARVVVVGGGYAGIMGALRAKRRLGPKAEVTLVSATDQLVERIRLHEQLASGTSVTRPLAERLEGSGVGLLVARALSVDTTNRRLALEGHPALDYDALLLAVGSVVDTSRIPGASEHAVALEPDTAAQLNARLRSLPAGSWVTIVGGGLTGLEAATEIAEQLPALHVRLVTRTLGEKLSEASTRHVAATLARLGIETALGEQVEAIERDAVVLPGVTLPSALTLVAPGFVAPPLARASGLPVDESGRLRVDEALRVTGAPGVYAAGDGAAAFTKQGRPVPFGCKSALPMGALVGETIASDLLAQTASPLVYRETVYCLSLGRHDGVLQLVRSDGAPHPLAARGNFGAFLKEQIVRFTIGVLESERRKAARAAARAHAHPALRARAVSP